MIDITQFIDTEEMIRTLRNIYKSRRSSARDKISAIKVIMDFSVQRPTLKTDATIDGNVSFTWEDGTKKEA